VEFDGKPALRAFIRVMTESMIAEQALKESEERYRQLIDASPDAVAVSQEGRLVLVNPAYLRLMGAPSMSDLLAAPLRDRIHPDYRALVDKRMEGVAAGIPAPQMEQKSIRLDGTVIDVEAKANPSCTTRGRRPCPFCGTSASASGPSGRSSTANTDTVNSSNCCPIRCSSSRASG
jgi:PAS domain S-box-containing protein